MDIDYTRLKRNYLINPISGRGDKAEKEDLEYLYLELNLNTIEIAEILNTAKYKVSGWITKYKIIKSKEMQQISTKNYWNKKYGVDNPRKLLSVQQKAKETNLKKYGHECAMHNSEIKQKMIQNNLKKYGVEYAGASQTALEKKRQNNMKKYGVEYPSQLNSVKEKARQTNIERYGVVSKTQLDTCKEQTKKTNQKRYGVDYPSQNSEIKEKVKKNNLQKYGVEWPRQLDTIKEKTKQTNLKKYGVECPRQAEVVKEKIKTTNLDRYGVEYPIQTEEIKDKRRRNNIEKWGTSNISTKHIPADTLCIINNKDKFRKEIENNKFTKICQIADHFKISYTAASTRVHDFNCLDLINNFTSIYELELNLLFPDFKKSKKAIYPYELDLYNKDLHLGIEFNGDYWHSDLHKDKDYHRKKSKFALQNNIFIYHIFEYEWKDLRTKEVILSQLNNLIGKNKVKIGARKCAIHRIDSNISSSFLHENHLQGKDHSSIRLGLVYDGELVSLMTFCKPRFNKKYDWELSRFCCKKNMSVIGAASKLFSYFTSTYEGTVISYSNMSKTKGIMYQNLGFQLLRESSPNYVWSNGQQTYSRYQTQKHKLTAYWSLGETEDEIMRNRGFYKIYDCGNKVWVYS